MKPQRASNNHTQSLHHYKVTAKNKSYCKVTSKINSMIMRKTTEKTIIQKSNKTKEMIIEACFWRCAIEERRGSIRIKSKLDPTHKPHCSATTLTFNLLWTNSTAAACHHDNLTSVM